MKMILAAAVFIAGVSLSSAQSSKPVDVLRVATPSEGIAVRDQIRRTIFGPGGSPALQLLDDQYEGHCCGANPDSYYGRTAQSTKWLVPRWGYGGGPYGMLERIHFAAFHNTSCLLIYNAGHAQSFWAGPYLSGPNVQNFVRRMVNDVHCDVILTSMPLQGENSIVAGYMGYDQMYPVHDYLGTYPTHAPPIGTPLRYWLDGVMEAITYAQNHHGAPYEKIVAAGLSGGGFRTTLLAAIDTRITHSYAIAGSVPILYRVQGEWDWEQVPAIIGMNLDFPDLYLMGTIDADGSPTRKVRLLYQQFDSCCFAALRVVGWAGWLMAYAKEHGFGSLTVYEYPLQTAHDVHPSHADAIIADLYAE